MEAIEDLNDARAAPADDAEERLPRVARDEQDRLGRPSPSIYRARRRCVGRDAVGSFVRMASARRKTASILIEALSSPGYAFTSSTAFRASGPRNPIEVSARMASSTTARRALAPFIDAGSLLAGEVVMLSGRDAFPLPVRSGGPAFVRVLSRCN